MFTKVETELPDLAVLRPRIFQDHRGLFVKTYHEGLFREMGLAFHPCEEFYSISAKNVVRGMHFQIPPAAHSKLVYCIAGSVLDVVLDIRRTSPAFGCCHARELSAANREMLFIPAGFAHGFLSLEDGTIMVYQTSHAHSPEHDAGIRWNSIKYNWPVLSPLVSLRDTNFPSFDGFSTPFA